MNVDNSEVNCLVKKIYKKKVTTTSLYIRWLDEYMETFRYFSAANSDAKIRVSTLEQGNNL